MVEKESSPNHLEEFSSHRLVCRYMRGEIPLDDYSKLFEEKHKTIDFLQILNDKNSGHSSLEAIVDNLEDRKNQIVEKVVDFVKRIRICDII